MFDSHAHYDDKAFSNDRDEVIKKLKDFKVEAVLNCASSIESCYKTLELVKKYDFFYGALGVHPEFSKDVDINLIGDLAQNEKIVAIGEIGLDYYWDYDRNIQMKAFKEQLDLARQLDLPVVIHNREAHEDTLKVLKEFKGLRGVLHCFSGSLEMAKEFIKLGYLLGFTGVVTFKNAKKTVEVVKNVPLEYILVETDCPYMAPHPHRGERNDSSYLRFIIEKIAEIKETTFENVKQKTFENAANLFNIF
ncbi:TatD DNase family protein [Caloramator fervidus]|uniref:TatD DNase family protein n=1 Tax=Caloramator fervidus TaxID=29344 RepID=A0A1H5RM01_9CLOT|nr:TatD family hydrolase [Caloramator fervidus]SEF38557.1 TatD DNase family protein [Caloramator fervidus]